MANQLLLILLCSSLFCLLKSERNVFLSDKNASTFLKRMKRANSVFEEFKKGNIERECYEEQCSKEEAREAFEDQEKTEEFWNVYVDGNQCDTNPCEYGGTCKDGIGTYTCTCLTGYEGKNCQHSIQKSCRVQNGGCLHFCRRVGNDVQCSCADGYILANDGQSCVSTDMFSCGRTITTRTKREANSPQHISSPSSDDGEIPEIPGYYVYYDPMDYVNATHSSEPQDETLEKREETETDSDRDPRIVNGTDCKFGECPWQALLLNDEGEGFCGGTILSHIYVLTAAHCMNQTKFLQVTVGERDTKARTGTVHAVDRVYVHHKFVLKTYDYDIALIKLRDPIQFSENVIPACLPTPDFANQILMNEKQAIVSGFGRIVEGGRISTTLKVVKLPYVDRHSCKLSSNFPITENMFCAGYSNAAHDACQGDSGGPHVTEYRGTHFVTGVISWGEGCAQEGKYGVYTKLSKFIGWLRKIMRIKPKQNVTQNPQQNDVP
ncbi:coagulation factor X [Elgaria multicarinata webbii]|uniref:coagulation factor X n=1 Tax=Elgaria multicarinata webbii TaxID=159646 RepID=UPI002FCD032F